MSRINKQLLDRLRSKLGVSDRQIYRAIARKAGTSLVPRDLAAIALAAEHGLNISKYASAEELAQLRGNVRQENISVTVPVPPNRNRPTRKVRQLKRGKGIPLPRRGNSVFVVHGRNETLRRSLFAFLRSINLNPIEWRKAIQLTGKASPYVSEILDAAFREAVAVVVLLSPDDEAKLKAEFLKANDPPHEKRLSGQARPNVLFEAGMAFGRNPDSTILVQVGEVKPFSDIGGRHVLHLSNSTESRQEFVTKLANAGCNVDSTGTDWHTEGDFE